MVVAARALLLDLDGTLVDSLPDLAASVNALLVELGAPVLGNAEIVGMVGDGARTLVERALAVRGLAAAGLDAAYARFLAIYEARPAALSRPFPGVVATLERLGAEGWRLAVCTNKPLRATRLMLVELGLDRYFGAVIAGDSLLVRKPDPQIFLAALQALDVMPSRGIAVGDHVNDLLAAASAGMRAIWANYGYGRRPTEPVPAATIGAFSELPAAAALLLPA